MNDQTSTACGHVRTRAIDPHRNEGYATVCELCGVKLHRLHAWKDRLCLPSLRRVARNLRQVGEFMVFVPLECEADARDLPNFVPIERIQTLEWLVRKLMLDENLLVLKQRHEDQIGQVERFVLVLYNAKARGDGLYPVRVVGADGREEAFFVAETVL